MLHKGGSNKVEIRRLRSEALAAARLLVDVLWEQGVGRADVELLHQSAHLFFGYFDFR